jgi:sugar O-acyltransferase (sialic acid O-acetyltransferase NeuD family)
MKDKIILIGGGGHCGSCIDVIEQEGKYQIAGIVDKRERLHERMLGYEIVATDDDLPDLVKEYRYFLISIGHVGVCNNRIILFDHLVHLGAVFPVIISPLAYVSVHSSIREGTIILHHALINAGVRIGKNCIINTKALIEHDTTIEDHCHISTGVIVNGGVEIGSKCFIGSNSTINQYLKIGESAVIDSGIRVGKDIQGYSRNSP